MPGFSPWTSRHWPKTRVPWKGPWKWPVWNPWGSDLSERSERCLPCHRLETWNFNRCFQRISRNMERNRAWQLHGTSKTFKTLATGGCYCRGNQEVRSARRTWSDWRPRNCGTAECTKFWVATMGNFRGWFWWVAVGSSSKCWKIQTWSSCDQEKGLVGAMNLQRFLNISLTRNHFRWNWHSIPEGLSKKDALIGQEERFARHELSSREKEVYSISQNLMHTHTVHDIVSEGGIYCSDQESKRVRMQPKNHENEEWFQVISDAFKMFFQIAVGRCLDNISVNLEGQVTHTHTSSALSPAVLLRCGVSRHVVLLQLYFAAWKRRSCWATGCRPRTSMSIFVYPVERSRGFLASFVFAPCFIIVVPESGDIFHHFPPRVGTDIRHANILWKGIPDCTLDPTYINLQ